MNIVHLLILLILQIWYSISKIVCICSNTVYKKTAFIKEFIQVFFHFLSKHCICDYYSQANNCKYLNFIQIPAWISAEFAETMFLLTGDLGIFDKAIGDDPVTHAIAQPKFNKFKRCDELSYFLELKSLTSF